MNTGKKKIFGKHLRQFLHKNNSETTKFDVLLAQNGIVVLQSNGKERQKSVVYGQICFFANKIY